MRSHHVFHKNVIMNNRVRSTLHVLSSMKSTSFIKSLTMLVNGGINRNCGMNINNRNLKLSFGLSNL